MAKQSPKRTDSLNSNLVEAEQLHLCPLCGSKKIVPYCQGKDRLQQINQQLFIYSKCKNCKLIFLSLRPIESEIYKFYSKDYEPYSIKNEEECIKLNELNTNLTSKKIFSKISRKIINNTAKPLNSIINRIFYDSLNNKIQTFYQPQEKGLKLLDFGCGSDVFLNNARKLGWETIGIDFSKQAIQTIRNSEHQGFLMSPQVWDEIEDESIDCVRMSHVLEHLYHPKEILQSIKLKMKPGAKLHIIVPNPEGISAKIFRSRWLDLDCPRHIMLYYPKVLRDLLCNIGLNKDLEIVPETLTSVLTRSFGYVMYDLGWIEHSQIQEMKDKRYLSDLLHTPIKIASILGIPDRIHVFLEK